MTSERDREQRGPKLKSDFEFPLRWNGGHAVGAAATEKKIIVLRVGE